MDRHDKSSGFRWEWKWRTMRWVRVGILAGLLGSAGSILSATPGTAPGAGSNPESASTEGSGKSAAAEEPQATPVSTSAQGSGAEQTPDWRVYIERLRQVNQEQARIRGQQDMLRFRINQPGGPPERVRDRVASRLHELDAQERDIRQKKREILQEIAAQGDKLRQPLEDAQADLLTREAAEADPEKRKQIGDEAREVEGLLRHLSDIQENPDRYVDFIPGRWDGPRRPDMRPEGGPIPPEVAARRIQQMEEQIHFLRRRLDSLERQVEEMKQFLGTQGMPEAKEPGAGPKEGTVEGLETPGPPPGFDQWIGPEHPRLMRPRRGAIPPAGFAPGSEPGLEPREGIPEMLPGKPEPLGPDMPAKPGEPGGPPGAPPQGPPPRSGGK